MLQEFPFTYGPLSDNLKSVLINNLTEYAYSHGFYDATEVMRLKENIDWHIEDFYNPDEILLHIGQAVGSANIDFAENLWLDANWFKSMTLDAYMEGVNDAKRSVADGYNAGIYDILAQFWYMPSLEKTLSELSEKEFLFSYEDESNDIIKQVDKQDSLKRQQEIKDKWQPASWWKGSKWKKISKLNEQQIRVIDKIFDDYPLDEFIFVEWKNQNGYGPSYNQGNLDGWHYAKLIHDVTEADNYLAEYVFMAEQLISQQIELVPELSDTFLRVSREDLDSWINTLSRELIFKVGVLGEKFGEYLNKWFTDFSSYAVNIWPPHQRLEELNNYINGASSLYDYGQGIEIYEEWLTIENLASRTSHPNAYSEDSLREQFYEDAEQNFNVIEIKQKIEENIIGKPSLYEPVPEFLESTLGPEETDENEAKKHRRNIADKWKIQTERRINEPLNWATEDDFPKKPWDFTSKWKIAGGFEDLYTQYYNQLEQNENQTKQLIEKYAFDMVLKSIPWGGSGFLVERWPEKIEVTRDQLRMEWLHDSWIDFTNHQKLLELLFPDWKKSNYSFTETRVKAIEEFINNKMPDLLQKMEGMYNYISQGRLSGESDDEIRAGYEKHFQTKVSAMPNQFLPRLYHTMIENLKRTAVFDWESESWWKGSKWKVIAADDWDDEEEEEDDEDEEEEIRPWEEIDWMILQEIQRIDGDSIVTSFLENYEFEHEVFEELTPIGAWSDEQILKEFVYRLTNSPNPEEMLAVEWAQNHQAEFNDYFVETASEYYINVEDELTTEEYEKYWSDIDDTMRQYLYDTAYDYSGELERQVEAEITYVIDDYGYGIAEKFFERYREQKTNEIYDFRIHPDQEMMDLYNIKEEWPQREPNPPSPQVVEWMRQQSKWKKQSTTNSKELDISNILYDAVINNYQLLEKIAYDEGMRIGKWYAQEATVRIPKNYNVQVSQRQLFLEDKIIETSKEYIIRNFFDYGPRILSKIVEDIKKKGLLSQDYNEVDLWHDLSTTIDHYFIEEVLMPIIEKPYKEGMNDGYYEYWDEHYKYWESRQEKNASSEYQDWSTEETGILIEQILSDSRILRPSIKTMEKIVRQGGSVQDLANWMIQNILNPYNEEIAQNWENISDEQDIEAQKNELRKTWKQQARKQFPFSLQKQKQYVQEMEQMQFGFFGEPEPEDIERYLLKVENIDWQGIYDWIKEDLQYRGKMAANDWDEESAAIDFILDDHEGEVIKYSPGMISEPEWLEDSRKYLVSDNIRFQSVVQGFHNAQKALDRIDYYELNKSEDYVEPNRHYNPKQLELFRERLRNTFEPISVEEGVRIIVKNYTHFFGKTDIPNDDWEKFWKILEQSYKAGWEYGIVHNYIDFNKLNNEEIIAISEKTSSHGQNQMAIGDEVAETTFEGIPDSIEEDDEPEEKIINGKKWKIVRPKHNPQPAEYARPKGGWGFYSKKEDAWEAVLDGELGHDIITTGTWEEVKKQTLKWLKQLKDGYINKENPHDNKKIDPEAKEQDGHAMEDLKLYEEKKRWSFHFDHGKHPYDLIIQPVGYKESKLKEICV